MVSATSEKPAGRPYGLLTTGWAEETGDSPSTPVTANGRDAIALIDSGSVVTLVRPEFAQTPLLEDTLSVTCIHGEHRQYPTTNITLKTIKGTYSGTAGVVPGLPVAVLIGRDFPLFRQLWLRLARGGPRKARGGPSAPPPRQRHSAPRLCAVQDVDPQGSTDPISEGESSTGEVVAEEEEGPGETREGERNPLEEEADASPSREEADQWDMFPFNNDTDVGPRAEPLAGRFGSAQLEDVNLTSALQQVSVIDGRLVEGVRGRAWERGCHVPERRLGGMGRPALPVGAEEGGVWQPATDETTRGSKGWEIPTVPCTSPLRPREGANGTPTARRQK
ncbi:uncharacterized protein LOC130199446 [Pseudoliparis swirei]|uniref:uncharacterized protein LOC130199446 n=1 Tax=Pseudoliparis swirei TaxID=2059687 RepID=UPI0024BD9116|nr:uncharacterized protein LOC130199446 [Pseudoliparis swirei]